MFFALWPDRAAAARLAELALKAQALCGGRVMRRETLHLTLAFIGEVAPERMASLRQAASRVGAQAYALSLDRLDCWRRNGIVWAGCREPAQPLIALAGQLEAQLSAAGFALEARSFMAHLTLLRDAQCLPLLACEAVAWPVDEFVLVESPRSSSGAGYTVVDRWPLLGSGIAPAAAF